MAGLEELFLHTKPSHIMVQLNHPHRENYISELSTEIDCTYSHAVRVIQKLEEKEIVQTHREGRKKKVELTDKGEEIAEILGDLIHELETE